MAENGTEQVSQEEVLLQPSEVEIPEKQTDDAESSCIDSNLNCDLNIGTKVDVEVVFSIDVEPPKGYTICLSGDHPALGSWNPLKAIPLENNFCGQDW